jgi:uncharacterized membrane protein YgaE (UPF0421/DUF939 family)
VTRRFDITQLPRLARLRVRGHLRAIAQTAVAAVTAWYVAALIGTEAKPTFATIAAVISLGATFGERPRKPVQLIAGVALGIVVADVLVRTIGTGPPEIGLLVLLAMLAAVMLGGSELLVSEAAVSAVLVASLPPSTADIRLVEGLVGGVVALLVHAFVFPPNPLPGVARAANGVFAELGIALRDAGAALSDGDPVRADHALRGAQDADRQLRELGDTLAIGRETARWAPMRRATRGELERFARTMQHLDPAVRESQLLGRDVLRFVRSGRTAPAELGEALHDLGRAVWEIPGQFDEPWRSGDVHVLTLGAATRATAAVEGHPARLLRNIAAHVRSVAVDITQTSETAEDAGGALADAATADLLVDLTVAAEPQQGPAQP